MLNQKVENWLRQTNSFNFSVFSIVAAFGTYMCMYAFRKPYTATAFDVDTLWGMNYKTILVIAQVIGYTVSKYAGIKFISEMKGNSRAVSILGLIGFAELMLLVFALVPAPYNFPAMFLNGLSLGMIWGLVFSYLEGRKFTELLGAGLSISFVVSSGWVKSVGKAILVELPDLGLSEFWMPVLTGAIYILPLFLFVWMLERIPGPTEEDIALRTKRVPMSGRDRWNFFKRFATGIVLLVITYMGLTAFRDFRDNFMADMFEELGVKESDVFARGETIVALVLLAIIGGTMLIRNNLKALIFNHGLIIAGFGLVGIGTALFESGTIGPIEWMIVVGIGGYMGYIPFNCILFERLIATFRYESNAGFLIYVADAFGYTAAITVMLYRDLISPDLSWVKFFTQTSWATVSVGIVLTLGSMIYFMRKSRSVSAVSPSS